MNRKQLYNEIVNLHLQNEVKTRYGKNYTNCTTVELERLVSEVHSNLKLKCVGSKYGDSTDHKDSAIKRLVAILAKKNILLKSEIETIAELF